MTIHLGARLRQLRGNLSQEAFATKLAIGRKSLLRYEAGERLPDAETLARVSRETGISADWLLFGDAAPDPDLRLLSDEDLAALHSRASDELCKAYAAKHRLLAPYLAAARQAENVEHRLFAAWAEIERRKGKAA
jgi:transcriptional regulator with XRE-family HTH domain